MSLFLKLSKNKNLSGVVRKNPALKAIAKFVYKAVSFPFTMRGVEVNIGGVGSYRLDHNFVFSKYEDFGDRHNAGFMEWVNCCKNKNAVFDIGAHIGLYTLPASRAIAAGGRVYAFEPSEANKMYLKRHLSYNGIDNVAVFSYLIGDVSRKEQEFFENKKTDPMNSIRPKKNIGAYKKVLKEQVSLDDFVSAHSVEPEVIKIDVEGAEYGVLKGASAVMRQHRPVIFLSVHAGQLALFGNSAEELMGLAARLGYIARDYNHNAVSGFKSGEYILTPKP